MPRFNLGLRLDHYDGLTTATLVQPRLGVSYAVPGSGTVLRASYGRTHGDAVQREPAAVERRRTERPLRRRPDPSQPGTRNQVEFGVQQAFGRWVVADFGYFNKRTDNAYDFGVLFDTPIVFPVAWDHSKIDGFTGRINLVEHRGFSAFVVMAHTNAIFSPPGVGGILLEQPSGDFRIDHDQKFNATTNLQYMFDKPHWRLGGAELAVRFGPGRRRRREPRRRAGADGRSAGGDRLLLRQHGRDARRSRSPTARVGSAAPRGSRFPPKARRTMWTTRRASRRAICSISAFGVDNLLHTDKAKLRVRFSVVNLTNKEALYNFLSTFSGTHFVTPRAYQVQVGVGF